MALYLLDTDVVSKRSRPNGANIRRWLEGVDDNKLAIGAITIFELSRGVQKKRDAGETTTADALQANLEILKAGFEDRILPIDAAVAEAWGALAGPDHKQWMDRGLIATARVHGLILVTCNSADMKGLGVEVINPDRNNIGRWEPDGTEIKTTRP